METKVVSTIVEDEVVFLSDADIEFVSLVKHGANRTPFKILKSEKGGTAMNKIVQAVLLRKDLPEEKVQEFMKDYSMDEVKEFDVYKSCIQCPKDQLDEDSLEVVILDEEQQILGVVGVPKEESDDHKVVEKDVEGLTLDDLYSELYAMADIVSGAMRQDNAESAFRRKTILTAIDNFRAYAELVLRNVKDGTEAVKSEDHPTLVHPLVVPLIPHEEPMAHDNEEEEDDVNKASEELGKIADQLSTIATDMESLKKKLDDHVSKEDFAALTKRMDDVESTMSELKSTPVTGKSDTDEEQINQEEDASPFKGLILKVK